MPSSSTDTRIARLNDRLARIEQLTERLTHELDLQFKRIAQLQAEVDEMRAASANIKEIQRRLG
jgi:uncharacterized coiled-coil protein SlyX